MDDDTTADEQAYSSGGEDIGRDHIPTSNLRKGITELTQKTLEGPAYENCQSFFIQRDSSPFQMEECHKRSHRSSDDAILGIYVRSQDWQPALSIIEDEFGFIILMGFRADGLGFRCGLRDANTTSEVIAELYKPYMLILSVVQIEVFSLYGYDYMKKIVLRRADLKEYIIAERDFKYLYPSDFEDLFEHTILDKERCRQKQGVHVCYRKMAQDKENLQEPGKLCWWTDKRRRLQTAEENRMISSSRAG
ncbi:hypothetical protein Tco_0490056 [Tanacetum coccineum]